MNLKIKWLRDKLKQLDMQGMIISNPINIKYLTNIEAEGTLLITRKENLYITDGRYVESANSSITIDDEIIVCDVRSISNEDYENFFVFCENVGFEENDITYAEYKRIMHTYKVNNLVETEYIIERQRMIKDEEEICKIKKACEITDKCFEHLLSYVKKGMTEKQIALEIENFYIENGAEGNSFDPIVATGPNSSMPHSIPTDRKIQSGDVILIDMGCKYQGYCSDMTRTIFMDYMPKEVKEVYDLVLKNQELTHRELKDGGNIRIISKAVENDFKLHDYLLIHSIGHGVGLEIHELPYMSTKSDKLLKDNMVLSNEPGIYVPGQFGIRIEDTVQITKNGCINLTKSTKNYTIIGNT